MQLDNYNKDPFAALQALANIDRIVKDFVEESGEGVLSDTTINFLHDLRVFCRQVYYVEPDEIEKAKSQVRQEDENGS